MNKIGLIIRREYLTRVKKKSFIIMTFLGPLLMAAVWIVPFFLTTLGEDIKVISVLDESGMFMKDLSGDENTKFVIAVNDLEVAKENLIESENYALLYIPLPEASLPTSAILYSNGQASLDIKNYIKTTMKKSVEDEKLRLHGIEKDILRSIKTNVFVSSIKLDGSGNEEKSSVETNMVVGLFSAILIYFFIFLFGAQVMRGVIEEKTSRVIEIIVSSVKPFQLMMGKIVGIAMVGLTQFILWIILTSVIVGGFQLVYSDAFKAADPMPTYTSQGLFPEQAETGEQVTQDFQDESVNFMIEAVMAINFPLVIGAFIFFFIGGYLLYAALFAAIGSAVDSEADTQQFMMPITIPLILSIVMAQFIINDPGGQVAFWFSMFPFTSPIIMMLRIPFGVQAWELALSGALLIAGFVFTTYVAGRIYRTGILMYGKKVSYKELWKWFFYKG
ncbi:MULTISPECIES: ABC transporter permease [unclassified Lentimicrobium]|uniref:ABC transporter permease n=1 Tax=unclassified Lentimicrobium TaxID=2677434 RepID=UPI001555BFB3|nr:MULTISPECIES: ABC transporter permease [unclassified Lentimicrobium]NPD46357.1 ABC transporter permease [Lentimicrobium sp. S6]NPD85004.1 ABC transporter permease [Lentimicrobium sp. L6]